MEPVEVEESMNSFRQHDSIESIENDESGRLLPSSNLEPIVPWYKRPSLWWLLPPFVFTSTMTGATITPRLSLMLALVCQQYYTASSSDPSNVLEHNCNLPEISAQVARLSTAFGLCTGILATITAGKYGTLSDQYGRRFAMSLAITGTLVNDVVIVLVAKYCSTLTIYFLFVGAFFDGVFGSFTTSMAATYAYVTDCVPPSRRAVAFGYFQCCFFGGLAIGPALGGFLVKKSGSTLLVFYVALGVHFAFLLYTLFILPESLSESRRKRAQHHAKGLSTEKTPLAHFIEFFNVFKILSIFVPKDARPSIKRNLVLLGSIDLILLLNMGAFTVVILYGKYVFSWGDLESGYFLSLIGLTRVIVLLVILPVIVRIFRGKSSHEKHRPQDDLPPEGADSLDIYLIRSSLFLEVLGFGTMAYVSSGNGFYVAGAISACAGIGMPTLSSVLTKHVPSSKTGQLLGAVALMQSLNRVVAPTIFGLLYSYTVKSTPAACFVVLSSAMLIGFFLTLGLRENLRTSESLAGVGGA